MEPRMPAPWGNEEAQHSESIPDATERGGEAVEGEEDGHEEDNAFGADEFELMFKRFAQEAIPVSVSQVTVQGNNKTRSSVVQAHLEPLKKAETTRQLLREAAYAVNRIEGLGLFEKCILSLESGPVKGSVNVVLHVQEGKMPCSLDLAAFSEVKDLTAALGSVKWKNMLGCGETWHGAVTYGWDGDHELSAGFYLPRFRRLPNALATRVAVSTPEWLKLSSYKVRITGVSVGLFSDNYQDLSYNLTWQPLQDNDCTDGPGLLPSLKYAFKIDERDSMSRPTRGYAFRFATLFAGGGSDVSKHSACQDVDFRFAIPLGAYNAALNIGLSGGFMLPWAKDYFKKSIYSTDRFFVRRHSSLVCEMNGPASILGLIARGTKPKPGEDDTKSSDSRDHFGGSLAATGFADLSFDLPSRGLKRQNMYGHCFVCAGNLLYLSEAVRGSRHFLSFLSSFKCFVGAGIVIPTRLFRLEVNFCHILGHHVNNESKRGVQISFSSPC